LLHVLALVWLILGGTATPALAQRTTAGRSWDLFPAELREDVARTKAHPARSDPVIAFWLERHDPLGTLRHQVYDARKGEYTTAVDDWILMIRRQYPDYLAYTRRVDVNRSDLATTVEKTVAKERAEIADALAPRLRREWLRSATPYSMGGAYPWTRRPWGESGPSPSAGIWRAPAAGSTSAGGPPPYLYPVPYPYPRPHP
jgi:hypothetical protein